jgi:hypothetical protein
MSESPPARPPSIDAYAFGRIEIDGQTYTKDLIILPAGVRPNWWRHEGHALKPGDLDAVFAAGPKVLVIGRGAQSGMRVTPEAQAALQSAGIAFVALPTADAVEEYNHRQRQGEPVAAALHLTC